MGRRGRREEAWVDEETNSWSSVHFPCCRNKDETHPRPHCELVFEATDMRSPHLRAHHPACPVMTQILILKDLAPQ